MVALGGVAFSYVEWEKPLWCTLLDLIGGKVTPGKEFFIDNLLVRIHFTIVMIRWTGLAPWEFEFPFPGSLTSTFLAKLLNY